MVLAKISTAPKIMSAPVPTTSCRTSAIVVSNLAIHRVSNTTSATSGRPPKKSARSSSRSVPRSSAGVTNNVWGSGLSCRPCSRLSSPVSVANNTRASSRCSTDTVSISTRVARVLANPWAASKLASSVSSNDKRVGASTREATAEALSSSTQRAAGKASAIPTATRVNRVAMGSMSIFCKLSAAACRWWCIHAAN